MREVEMCATSNNTFLAMLHAEKKIVGHYFLEISVHILKRCCYFLGYRSTDKTRTNNK